MIKEGSIVLDNSLFNKMELNILKDVTCIAKSLLNTFKFQVIYHTRVPKQMEIKTLKLVRQYRKEFNGKSYKQYLQELFSS